MQIPSIRHRVYSAAFFLCAVALVGCSSGGGAGWTYAPLGPTPAGTAAASAPASPQGMAINVETTSAAQYSFSPATLTAPPETVVTVIYANNDTLQHNIHFFNGADASAPSLGATNPVTGPNAVEQTTFTTPAQTGNYFFWCDVHGSAMTGTLTIAR